MFENLERICASVTQETLNQPISRRMVNKASVAAGVSTTLFFMSSGLAKAYEPSWPGDFYKAEHTPRKSIQWVPIYPETAQYYNSLMSRRIPGYNLLTDTAGGAVDKLDIVTNALKPGKNREFTARDEMNRIVAAIKVSNTPKSSAGLCQGRADAAILVSEPLLPTPVEVAGVSFNRGELDFILALAYAACWPKNYTRDIGAFINNWDGSSFGADVSQVSGEFWSTAFDGVSKDGVYIHGQDTLTGDWKLYQRKDLLAAWEPQLDQIDPHTFLPIHIPLLPEQKQWWLQYIAGLDDRGVDMDVVNYLVHGTAMPKP